MIESEDYQELSITYLELSLSDRDAKVLSTLARSVYGCKNVLKRGKKRELLKRLFIKESRASCDFDFSILKWKCYFTKDGQQQPNNFRSLAASIAAVSQEHQS